MTYYFDTDSVEDPSDYDPEADVLLTEKSSVSYCLACGEEIDGPSSRLACSVRCYVEISGIEED